MNQHKLDDVALQHPWAKEMVQGKGGVDALKIKRKKPRVQRVNAKQSRIVARVKSGNGY